MNIKIIKTFIACLLAIIAVSYVTYAGTTTPTLIRLTMPSTSINYSSEPINLTLTGTYSDRTVTAVSNNDAIWTSSDTSIATAENGQVVFTGKKGSVAITAKIGTISAKVTANVSFTLAIANIGFSLTTQQAIATATYTTSYTTQPAVVWSSTNLTVATVDSSSGVIAFTGKKGTTSIKATYGGVTGIKNITVNPVLTIADIPITTGYNVAPLKVTASYGNNITNVLSDVVWTSSNQNVAIINGNGLCLTGKLGSTTITCSFGSQKVQKTISVDANFTIPVHFSYSPNLIKLSVQANYGQVAPVAIASGDVTWASSNTKVATVDGNGVVTFTGTTGVVKITATIFGKYKTSVETYVPTVLGN